MKNLHYDAHRLLFQLHMLQQDLNVLLIRTDFSTCTKMIRKQLDSKVGHSEDTLKHTFATLGIKGIYWQACCIILKWERDSLRKCEKTFKNLQFHFIFQNEYVSNHNPFIYNTTRNPKNVRIARCKCYFKSCEIFESFIVFVLNAAKSISLSLPSTKIVV